MINRIEEAGQRFFGTRKKITGNLIQFSQALSARDLHRIKDFYSDGFRGHRLGLTTLQLETAKHGVQLLRLSSQGKSESIGRDEAAEEWRAYLDSFESIEEVGL